MVKDKFSFGSNPKMREVPPGTEAKFRFNGAPEIVETEWGEKYSFPITLLSHDSYDSLPIDCHWESKSMVAREVFNVWGKAGKEYEDFHKAYENSTWQLTRFDTGAYFLDQR
tara:strand:- start:780 stop:1115 length:336 start_codon:yes stop_codon:yes gene_type:complete